MTEYEWTDRTAEYQAAGAIVAGQRVLAGELPGRASLRVAVGSTVLGHPLLTVTREDGRAPDEDQELEALAAAVVLLELPIDLAWATRPVHVEAPGGLPVVALVIHGAPRAPGTSIDPTTGSEIQHQEVN